MTIGGGEGPAVFDHLFGHAYMVRRWRQGPSYSERIEFLEHLARLDYARRTLKLTAYLLLGVVEYLPLERHARVTVPEICKAARKWRRRPLLAGPAALTQSGAGHFMRVAKAWFMFLGRLYQPPRPPGAFDAKIADFVRWMREERGLMPGSVATFQSQIVRFLEWWNHRSARLTHVAAADVDAYFNSARCQQLSRKSIALAAHALRTFFRFANNRGWCETDIASGIDRPPVYRHSGIPLGPTWKEVRRLIDSTVGNKPTDMRSRALFLLLATYGLRVGEVAHLTLDDLDWEHELIRVNRGKGRRMASYPMTTEVGLALARYIRSVRPRVSRREVFVTLVAPFRPLNAKACGRITSRRFGQLDIQSTRHGPHALRHACATHLMQQGASLKEIADQLGHRSLMTTGIYAKVDMNALRNVADFDLKGLA